MTITGTNDTPAISLAGADKDASSLTETDTTLTYNNGTLTLTDIDVSDTVSTVKVNGVTKGGTYTGPLPTDATLISMFTAGGSIDATNTAGKIYWNSTQVQKPSTSAGRRDTDPHLYSQSTDSSGAATTLPVL